MLYADLKELNRKLRSIPAKVPEIDPWLSLHLYAHRMERLHADFCERLGIPEQDGLGRRGKFLLLIFQTEADLVRYLSSYCRSDREGPTQHLFAKTDSLLFATAAGALRGALVSDDAMHSHVVFSVSQNLLEGYCDYSRRPPLWFTEGLAHWYARRVDPRHNNFGEFDPAKGHRMEEWEWEPIVWGRVRHQTDPPLDRVLAWHDVRDMDLVAHAVAWSRTAFLMGLGDEGFARFVDFCREHPPRSRHMPDRLCREWHERALAHAWRLDLDEFEARWRRFVLETYERR